MRKLLLFGNSGSGKSTLAKQLAESEKLAHLDLDTLAWLKVMPPARTPLDEASLIIQDFINSHEGWVIEGCYTDLLELVCPQANEIIFMDIPVAQCIENAENRPWEPHKYDSKKAQDDNLEMLIQWIKDYENRDDVFSFHAHQSFYENFSGKKARYIDNERKT